MSKKKTVSDGAEDISINIFYSVKGSKKTRRLSLTPKEYFWRLTKREIKDHYVHCVEREWDARDYIKDSPKSDVVFCVSVVRNFFTKESQFVFEFYFGAQRLTFRQKYSIDAEIPDFCAVYSRDEDELYDIARVDGDFNKIDKENQVRFYRVLARNDDKKIIEIERKVRWEKLLK